MENQSRVVRQQPYRGHQGDSGNGYLKDIASLKLSPQGHGHSHRGFELGFYLHQAEIADLVGFTDWQERVGPDLRPNPGERQLCGAFGAYG
jgi:hypothetical protein